MIHGEIKKNEKISDEEKQKKEELAERININLKEFFELRHGKKDIPEKLEFTTIITQLCPDLYSAYNFRRELILEKFKSLKEDQKYEFVIKEINILNALSKRMSKSYSIWHHRFFFL